MLLEMWESYKSGDVEIKRPGRTENFHGRPAQNKLEAKEPQLTTSKSDFAMNFEEFFVGAVSRWTEVSDLSPGGLDQILLCPSRLVFDASSFWLCFHVARHRATHIQRHNNAPHPFFSLFLPNFHTFPAQCKRAFRFPPVLKWNYHPLSFSPLNEKL